MLKRLTQNQLDDYRRGGFVHPITVMSGEEADIIRERLEGHGTALPKRGEPREPQQRSPGVQRPG